MFDVKVLSEPDRQLLVAFEQNKPSFKQLSPMEKEMNSWDQPWRGESLDHYIQLGWSFVAKNEGEVVGYILCQPLLFFKNYTQSLWIEYTSFEEEACGQHLIEVACRWARSKHLQKVFINQSQHSKDFIQQVYPQIQEGSFLHLNATKMAEA